MKSKYRPKQYIELVERLGDPVLDRFMRDEMEFIEEIVKQKRFHVFDLGAGYGRIIPGLVDVAASITAIEIDDDMFEALVEGQRLRNVNCLKEDITALSRFLTLSDTYRNLFLLCQNTLGVIEGDYKEMFDGLKKLGCDGRTEVVVSVFNKEALKSYGVSLYKKLTEMVGEIDINKSDLDEGVFVSQNGYVSKWWSKEEIMAIASLMNARVDSLKETAEYSVYHLQMSPK